MVEAIDNNLVQVGVQVNGKMRGCIELKKDASETVAVEAARALEKVEKFLAGKELQKVVYKPGFIINFINR